MTDTSYWTARLAHETDPADVYAEQRAGREMVILDVRSAEAWKQGRVSGALHMPYREIPERAPLELDHGIAVVVYCWSPGCNAGVRGALALAELGYDVKEMIGGYEYWVREGQPVEDDEGPLPRTFDPLVMTVHAEAAPSRR